MQKRKIKKRDSFERRLYGDGKVDYGWGTRSARETVTPLRSESFVYVVFAAASLRLIEIKPLTRGRDQVIVANSVAGSLPSLAFHDLMTNLSNKSIHLLEKMLFAHVA